MKWKRSLAIVTLVILITNIIPYQVFADSLVSGNVSRIYGQDRIDTALAICAAGWSTSNTVILTPANQENMADTLSALSLAGQEKAPVLLTDKDQLDKRVLDRIDKLEVRKIYAIGALSDSLINTLRGETEKSGKNIIIEVLKGQNRQETADKINSLLKNPSGLFIVGKEALVDALSAGSYAYANTFAYSYSNFNSSSISKVATQNYSDQRSLILGGQNVVQNIPGVTRISGENRYETNRAIIDILNMRSNTIYIANGADDHLADALAGAALAGKTGSPIYLTDGTGTGLNDLIKDKIKAGSSLVFLGGTSALSENARMRITGVNDSQNLSCAVSELKPLNLLQFAIEFNKTINRETGENVENYIVDGHNLTSSDASAELQADGRTVVITLNAPLVQFSSTIVEVKENKVLAADRKTSAPGFEGSITVSDKVVPVIQNVMPEGSKKLTVRFSEAVSLSNTMMDYQLWKLDGQGITTRGLQTVKVTKGIESAGRIYGTELEMYFGTSLGNGNHILEIPTKDVPEIIAGSLFKDGAGYRLDGQEVPFFIQGVSGSPTVKIEKTEGNTAYLKFDRPMYSNAQNAANNGDPASALNVNNYTINSVQGAVLSAEFIKGSDQSIVKLVISPEREAIGTNLITLNKKIEDLYGCRLVTDSEGDDIRLNFTVEDDNIKPQVEKLEVVGQNVIRVTFSKEMNGLYAMNKANYLLKNADGVSIQIDTINVVPNSNMTVIQGAYPCSDIYEIYTNQPLYGAGYTLKLTNVQDMAFRPNTISEVTLSFNGRDNTHIKALEVTGEQGGHKLVVLFSEVMSPGSILDTKNYVFLDGDNASGFRSLPTGSKINAGPENRSAVITFPDAYIINTSGISIPGHDLRYQVTALEVMNVKDEKGYVLEGGFSLLQVIPPSASAYKPQYITDSFIVKEGSNDNIRVEFKLDQVLEKYYYRDFQVGTVGNKITADSGQLNGRTVILTFTDSGKITAVRSLGKDLMLFMSLSPSSSNIAGVEPAAFPAGGYQVYDDQVRPRVLGWSLEESAGDDYALVTFSKAIDGTVTGLYEDNFTFYYGGTALEVKGVRIYTDVLGNPVPNVLVYDLADGNYTRDGMTVRMNEKNLGVRDVADRRGDHNTIVYKDGTL
ncbi:MAG: cell wall-binding repeat-containing protein [Peptococcaceae bacterium]|nr:cell wall-binding repeat-containing protein [Peptococcaceae bacterium]